MPDNVTKLITSHPAIVAAEAVGTPGFTLPSGNFKAYELNMPGVEAELAQLGIKLAGTHGENCWVYADPQMQPINLAVRGIGLGGNTVVVPTNSRFRGAVVFEGTEHLFVAGSDCPTGNIVTVNFRTARCAAFCGKGSSLGGTTLWVEGPEKSIVIGDDSMFSWNTHVRTSDGHAIINLSNMEKINAHRSITVGSHVWVGQDVVINQGVVIGSGSVVGMHSVVTKDVAPCSLVIGIPARVHRSGVSWTRTSIPRPQDLKQLTGLPAVQEYLASLPPVGD